MCRNTKYVPKENGHDRKTNVKMFKMGDFCEFSKPLIGIFWNINGKHNIFKYSMYYLNIEFCCKHCNMMQKNIYI